MRTQVAVGSGCKHQRCRGQPNTTHDGRSSTLCWRYRYACASIISVVFPRNGVRSWPPSCRSLPHTPESNHQFGGLGATAPGPGQRPLPGLR